MGQMRENLATLLDDFHRLDGEIAVVRYQGNRRRVTTYGELARLAGRFAALLERRGIGVGDRVLLWGENSAEWIAAFHGCLLRGALAVPLDAHGTAEFALRVAADVRPKLAVGDAVLLAELDSPSQSSGIENSSHPSRNNKDAARVGHPAELQSSPTPTLSGKSSGKYVAPGSGKNGVPGVSAFSEKALRKEVAHGSVLVAEEDPPDPAGDWHGFPILSSEIRRGGRKDGTQELTELDAFPRLAFEDWAAELPLEEAEPVNGLSHSTPLEILFTSGTTGDPKGVVLTHGNVLASVAPIEQGARPYLRYERLVHPLRILHTLPLSHVFGQTMGLWVPFLLKAEVHFESRPAAPRLIQLIKEERISVLAAVPRVLALLKAHLEMLDSGLAERLEQAKEQKIGALRKWWRFRKVHRAFGLKFWAFVSGGGALAGPLEQFWNALGFVLVQGYGMTETTALITLNHPFHVARGTIGKPLAGREVKLGPDGEVLVRGPMISGATWQGGAVKLREDEWLATGDLAEKQESGELKFLGRKSEVIVTAAGVNLHPEDMESAVEEQPGVAACAVVAMETATGPEPCAVLAVRGPGDLAAKAVERANERLAEFQRIRRWVLWPEPDLPRTSTGKVRRKAVAAWLSRVQVASNGHSNGHGMGSNGARAEAFGASQDWLLALIAQITGETPDSVGDEQRLAEDLHLDSLGRVQLAAAIEERLGIVSVSGLLEEVQTLGELRRLVAGGAEAESESGSEEWSPTLSTEKNRQDGAREGGGSSAVASAPSSASTSVPSPALSVEPMRARFVYPEWPWWKPVEWMRIVFIEAVMRPLVWLLADPGVTRPKNPLPREPMLIVANHVSTFDGPLVQYALEGRVRRHIAAAMLGEMLEEYRHWRNPERKNGKDRFYPLGPLAYFLVTALFNVFPLPRHRDFQTSFAHAGKAMDRGYNVLVFPEGTRSAAGKLAPFRAGIGLLAKQSGVPVLPVAIRGVGELKTRGRDWFRSGTIEVCVGEPLRFAPEDSEAVITARLQQEVSRLLEGTGNRE
jgi:long-chain acyl-CoA synthetase